MTNADVFVGVSVANVLSPTMLKTMARDPIVFALANPDPEINPTLARKTREDVIIATGRSDFPNQVNNVLGFPYLFRGALDVQATMINDAMKIAAVKAIASLAKDYIPEQVLSVYKDGGTQEFGRDYLIPKPVDQRVLLRVAPAVAKAAMDSGVARKKLDLSKYQEDISNLLGPTQKIIRSLKADITQRTILRKGVKPHLVIPHAEHPHVIQAVKEVLDEGQIELTLLGNTDHLHQRISELSDEAKSLAHLVNPTTDSRSEIFAKDIYAQRKRKGVTMAAAIEQSTNHHYFAASLLAASKVQGLITGVSHNYIDSVRPLIEIVGVLPGQILTGIYLIIKSNSLRFFADCTMNIQPNAEQLANISAVTADFASTMTPDPLRVALLSFANFGASKHSITKTVARATEILHKERPDLVVDGEMQVDTALNSSLRKKEFSFSKLNDNANVLIFPDLNSANIGHKLLTNLGDVTSIGPVLLGLKKTANVLQQEASVQEIINMIYLTAHSSI